jgi:hypothetical protein
MKKLLCLMAFIALLLGGCGTAEERAEFWKHDTMYKSWDHLKFSWYGYEKPTAETGQKSQDQGWWGKTIEFTP